MPFTALVALGWAGVSSRTLSPLGALESFLGALAIVALTIWLCGESVRQRAEQARADAPDHDPSADVLH